jgi:hypothetical protein
MYVLANVHGTLLTVCTGIRVKTFYTENTNIKSIIHRISGIFLSVVMQNDSNFDES